MMGASIRCSIRRRVPTLGLASAPEFPARLWRMDSSDGLSVLDLRPDELAQATPLATVHDYWRRWCVDARGWVWIGLRDGGLRVERPGAAPIRGLLTAEQVHSEAVEALRAGPEVLVVAHGAVYRARPGAVPALDRIATLPEAAVLASAADAAGAKLYLALERRDPDGAAVPAIGYVDLAPESGPVGVERALRARWPANRSASTWQEYDLPGLATIGQISQLAVGADAGGPQLWMGGTEGLIAADLAAAPLVAAPPVPYLDYSDVAPVSPGIGAPAWRLPYADNQIKYHFGVPVFSAAGRIYYETRLRGRARDWSAPSPIPVAQFSYLRGGPLHARGADAQRCRPGERAAEPGLYRPAALVPHVVGLRFGSRRGGRDRFRMVAFSAEQDRSGQPRTLPARARPHRRTGAGQFGQR